MTINNKKYNIYYNHDKDCDASQKDKLVERFSKRIENFKQALCSDKFIYFVLDSDFEIKQKDIDNLYNKLCEIRDKTTGGVRRLSGGFKLIILDFFKSKLKSPDENNTEIIELPHPYELFERDWWCVECQKSHQGLLFKKSAAVLVSKIIEKQHKIELFNDELKLKNKKRIFINFTDMPGAYIGKHSSWYNHPFITILEKYYDVVITEKPDFLFYNVFGDNFKKYKNCVKIYFTANVAAPNFNQCDYAMGFDFINFEDRYYRYPLYFAEVDEKMNDKSKWERIKTIWLNPQYYEEHKNDSNLQKLTKVMKK